MSAYYNENDKYAAQWLRNLIASGHLPAGDVDERSIEDVRPDDLAGYDQCHFFAGIGGWPYALRLAGVPDDAPIWTGSCPCQPFSTAGKQRGKQDERHLWPVWYKLIDQCRPAIVFGEQVASPLARAWLDDVFDGLENAGYACAAANLCAASVGAPHIRQRLYWMAYSNNAGLEGWRGNWKYADKWAAWQDGVAVACRDGKHRIAPAPESGILPMDDGLPNRVEQLRAYGNAIVPQVAAEFIRAVFYPPRIPVLKISTIA